MDSKIVQLIPSEGFSAEYKDGFRTLAGFALVERLNSAGDPYREVIGLVLEDGNYNPVEANTLAGFQRYRRLYATLSANDQKPKKGKKGLADERSFI